MHLWCKQNGMKKFIVTVVEFLSREYREAAKQRRLEMLGLCLYREAEYIIACMTYRVERRNPLGFDYQYPTVMRSIDERLDWNTMHMRVNREMTDSLFSLKPHAGQWHTMADFRRMKYMHDLHRRYFGHD